MARYIDADALLESLKNFTYAEPCTEFQRGVNAVVPLILSEIKHFHLADVVQAPEKTCSTCQCNKVCDHNKYGFENCGNYISDDLALRAEVAREIVEDVKETLLDYHLQENKKYLKSTSKTKKQFDIETQRYIAVTDAIKFALETLNEIEDRYTEEGK